MNQVTHFNAKQPLNTAVLFLVFNRLETTKQVFEAIRQAKPPRLYIAADGARTSKPGEAEKVYAVRDFIIQRIDWECEVKTLFREQNLGCKYAVSGAITWFFENEQQGIILEDDCLPSQSFFWYCEELLEKYKDDKSVYLVSGDARGAESFGMQEDYGFCKYPLIWGWASWARAWKNYDSEIADWPKQREILPSSISNYKPTVAFWKNIFERMYHKEIDTWDYQFSYLLLKTSGKCIVPRINLITNVGFGADATHTFSTESDVSNRKRYEINIPLAHSQNIESEIKINDFYDKNTFTSKSFIIRAINKLARLAIGKNIF
ncbi:hypothetical protein [Aeromonas veronii]|uniref:hypothetical protein n=1 Tax=Aeromonas veronii TaxID=654 RepID=UPI0018F125B5|nr:hypothetical protein [Aeromonas veronii]MBJ7591786.1 hypothetical protein [Aeromonas veronii]